MIKEADISTLLSGLKNKATDAGSAISKWYSNVDHTVPNTLMHGLAGAAIGGALTGGIAAATPHDSAAKHTVIKPALLGALLGGIGGVALPLGGKMLGSGIRFPNESRRPAGSKAVSNIGAFALSNPATIAGGTWAGLRGYNSVEALERATKDPAVLDHFRDSVVRSHFSKPGNLANLIRNPDALNKILKHHSLVPEINDNYLLHILRDPAERVKLLEHVRDPGILKQLSDPAVISGIDVNSPLLASLKQPAIESSMVNATTDPFVLERLQDYLKNPEVLERLKDPAILEKVVTDPHTLSQLTAAPKVSIARKINAALFGPNAREYWNTRRDVDFSPLEKDLKGTVSGLRYGRGRLAAIPLALGAGWLTDKYLKGQY